MPQMAPISWLNLFIIFTISFMIFNMMNYFIYIPMMPKSSMKKESLINDLKWKW
uniref:ATP synthase complex subunit 8 n=1 Tax=Limnophora tigrina TaxID=2719073 RepID=A0A7L7S0F2_9MUSC|nr:ATP synthase F0 subunit 8 [Limnophora tigrina]